MGKLSSPSALGKSQGRGSVRKVLSESRWWKLPSATGIFRAMVL